jgi:2'-5' RNA ligase
MQYNIALIPTIHTQTIIQLASPFADIKDDYLLGLNSLPHVTLYQFNLASKDLEKTWSHIAKHYQHLKPLKLTFTRYSFTSSDKKTYWIALLPDVRIILDQMHTQIAEILKLPIKKSFEPHMTLCNTLNKNSENLMLEQAKKFILF